MSYLPILVFVLIVVIDAAVLIVDAIRLLSGLPSVSQYLQAHGTVGAAAIVLQLIAGAALAIHLCYIRR